jgi:hypothetical protein
MKAFTLDDDWKNNLNVRNLLNYYQAELLELKKGSKIVDSVSFGSRKRLIEYGILRRFGSKYELTDRGLTLLSSITKAY